MQTCSTSSNSTTFLLPSHLSSSSSLDQTDDLDEHTSLDNAPLLPQHHQSHKPPRKERVRWLTCSEIRHLNFALAGLTFAATALLLWLFLPYLYSRSSAKFQEIHPTFAPNVNLNETRQFLSNHSIINEGYVPFPLSAFSPLYASSPLQHTLSTSSFPSQACLDQYVSKGEICETMRNRWSATEDQPKLDLIWTWTNGSRGELMAEWKEMASLEGVKLRKRFWKRVKGLLGGNMLKHFREHDELKFSIRSAFASLPSASIANLHLIVGDTPSYRPDGMTDISPLNRKAQIPRWLDLSTVDFDSSPSKSSPALQIHPHSELFKSKAPSEQEATLWRDSILPSFNSLAIESQLANLKTDSATAVYLNDDFFLNEPLSVADLESPLTGPVFRMQRDLLVGGVDSMNEQADPDSEWKSLGTAGHLLNRRFGDRKRPYLVHVAKAVSMPMLKEMQAVFIDELTQTAEARFRGRGAVEAQTMHLLVHYTIEKHREALLWSFLVARSNPSSTGFYSSLERKLLLEDLGWDFPASPSSSQVQFYAPRRSSLSQLSTSFEETRLPLPKETTMSFTSQDGYAYLGLAATVAIPECTRGWPSFSTDPAEEREEEDQEPVCTLDLSSCFGSDFLDTSDDGTISVEGILKRISFEQPSCGDCLIAKLVGSSGEKGLEAFLPEATDEDSRRSNDQVEVAAIGLEGTSWNDVDFGVPKNVSRRNFAISLIQRYSYAIGTSSAAFRSIKGGGEPLSEMLKALSFSDASHDPPAFLALNDDIYSPRLTVAKDVNKRLGEWFRKVWPEPSKWEGV